MGGQHGRDLAASHHVEVIDQRGEAVAVDHGRCVYRRKHGPDEFGGGYAGAQSRTDNQRAKAVDIKLWTFAREGSDHLGRHVGVRGRSRVEMDVPGTGSKRSATHEMRRTRHARRAGNDEYRVVPLVGVSRSTRQPGGDIFIGDHIDQALARVEPDADYPNIARVFGSRAEKKAGLQ